MKVFDVGELIFASAIFIIIRKKVKQLGKSREWLNTVGGGNKRSKEKEREGGGLRK